MSLNDKKKIFIFLMLFILATITLVSASIEIKTIKSDWVITKYTGNESKDLSLPTIQKIGNTNYSICFETSKSLTAYPIKDATNKDVIFEKDKNKATKYCSIIDSKETKYIKIGVHSIIIELMDINIININENNINTNISVSKLVGAEWSNSINDIKLQYDENQYKYSGIDNTTISEEVNYYKSEIKSNSIITNNGDNTYSQSNKITYAFFDICNIKQDHFDPECQFNLTSQYELEVISKVKHNDILGYTYYDPTVNFTTNSIDEVYGTALSKNTFVLAWCDSTNQDMTFKVFNTTGYNLTPEIDVDDSISTCPSSTTSPVSVAAFNSTSFVIAWHDFGDSHTYIQVYNSSGFNTTTIFDLGNLGSSDVSVSAFNSTDFVIGYTDNPNGKVYFQVFNSSLMFSIFPVEVATSVGSSAGVSVSAFNSTDFVVGWHDQTNSDVYYKIYNNAGTNSTTSFRVTENSGNNPVSIGVSALTSTSFVIGWSDSTNSIAHTFGFNTDLTPLFNEINITGLSSSPYSYSVSALGSGKFAVGWTNSSLYQKYYGFNTYSNTGLLINSRVIENITSDPGAPYPQQVLSYSVATGIGLCGNNFIFAYVPSTSYSTWNTFASDGTYWNGYTCPSGNIGLDLIHPIGNEIVVSQYDFFNISVNVSCHTNDCGTINVTLDPLNTSTYRFRKTINITENSNATLTNYQVNFTINTQSLIANAKMQSDCDDVRFTDLSNELLNFTLFGCGTNNTKFVVKVDSIPSASVKQIYMYYGNNNAVSASDRNGTYEWYDDFSTNTTDMYQYYSVAGYFLDTVNKRMYLNMSTDGGIIFNGTNLTLKNVLFEADFQRIGGGDSWIYSMIRGTLNNGFIKGNANGWGCIGKIGGSFGGEQPKLGYYNTGENSQATGSYPFADNTWYHIVFTANDSYITCQFNSSSKLNTTNSNIPDAGYIGIGGKSNMFFTNLSVRKWAYPEPTTIVGAEENMTVKGIIPYVDAGYGYRQLINITESSGVGLTNYQINITINTAALISDSKMKADCSDIKFTDLSDNAFTYALIDGCNTPVTLFYVKVDSIIANSLKQIYMYYENPDTVSTSSKASTYAWYDDFSADTRANYNFTTNINNYIFDTANKQLAMNFSGSGGALLTSLGNMTNAAIEVDVLQYSGADKWIYIQARGDREGYFIENSINGWGCNAKMDGNNERPMLRYYNTGGNTVTSANNDLTTGNWYHVIFKLNNSYASCNYGNNDPISGTSANILTAGYIGIGGGNSNSLFANLSVRQYTNPEPVVAYNPEEVLSQRGLRNFASPFWTNVTNPYVLTLNNGESQVVTWYVNATASSGTYPFFVYGLNPTDESSYNISNEWNVTILTSTITINYPLNGGLYNNLNLDLNVTSGGIDIDTWWYSLNGAANQSFTPNTTITGIDGNNTLIVYANDTSNSVYSSSISFNIDATAPNIDVISPTEGAVYPAILVELKTSSTATNIDTWWYSLNGDANQSFTPNTTITATIGANTIIVYVNDTLGNMNQSSLISFTVSLDPTTRLKFNYTNVSTGNNFDYLCFIFTGGEFCFNETLSSGSSSGGYNATYDLWAYNQTTATAELYSSVWNSTYNSTYAANIDTNCTLAGSCATIAYLDNVSSQLSTYANQSLLDTYANKTYVDSLSNWSSDKSDYFTSNEVSTQLNDYVNNTKLGTYANLSQVATLLNDYVNNTKLGTYANLSQVATQLNDYVNNTKLGTYANQSLLSTYQNQSSMVSYANQSLLSTYANLSQVTTLLNDYVNNTKLGTYANQSLLSTYANMTNVNSNFSNVSAAINLSISQKLLSNTSYLNSTAINTIWGTNLNTYANDTDVNSNLSNISAAINTSITQKLLTNESYINVTTIRSILSNYINTSANVTLNGNITFNNTISQLQSKIRHAANLSHGSGGAQLDGACSVYVSGDYAYVSSEGSNSTEIVDISNPYNPIHVANLSNGSIGRSGIASRSIIALGNYLYALDTLHNKFNIIDISNITMPVIVGSINDGAGRLNFPSSIYISGKYAYITSYGSNALEIVDISNPYNPIHVANLSDDFGGAQLLNPTSVYVSGKYAYITSYSSDALEIVDISNPYNPTHIANLTNSTSLNGVMGVYISGKYAYMVSTNSLEIVDISNPYDPTHIANLSDDSGGAELTGANSVFISGKYAYITSPQGSTLEIVDISDPYNPTHSTKIVVVANGAQLSGANSVFISGKYAYVASKTSNALEIIDLSGIDSPAAEIGVLKSSQIDVTDNMQIGNNLYVGNGLNVGAGGLYSAGDVSVYGNLTVTNTITGNGSKLFSVNYTETDPTIGAQLNDYVNNTKLGTYANQSLLSTYQNQSSMVSYANQSLLSTYANLSQVTTLLNDYVNKTQLSNNLVTYMNQSNFTTYIGYYPNKSKSEVITGAWQFTDNVIFGKNVIVIGNLTSANVSNLNMNGSLMPPIDNFFTLGNATFTWKSAYIGNMYNTTQINTLLSTYQNQSSMVSYANQSLLSTYANLSQVTTLLNDYVNNTKLSTYANQSLLSTYQNQSSMVSYANQSLLSTYANLSQVTTLLNDYVNNTKLSTYANQSLFSTYANMTNVNSNFSNVSAAINASISLKLLSNTSYLNSTAINTIWGTNLNTYANMSFVNLSITNAVLNNATIVKTNNLTFVSNVSIHDNVTYNNNAGAVWFTGIIGNDFVIQRIS